MEQKDLNVVQHNQNNDKRTSHNETFKGSCMHRKRKSDGHQTIFKRFSGYKNTNK